LIEKLLKDWEKVSKCTYVFKIASQETNS